MVGTPPAGCQSPSVNKALIGCCPVGTRPPEKSNYWLRGFKAAQGRWMKGDKLGTVSRTPAGRPGGPGAKVRGEPSDQRTRRRGEAGARPGRPSPAGVSDLGGGCGRGPRGGLRRARGWQVSARAPRAQAWAQDQQRGRQSRLRRRPDPAAGTGPRVAGAAGRSRALRLPERPRREERRRTHPRSAGDAIGAAIP